MVNNEEDEGFYQCMAPLKVAPLKAPLKVNKNGLFDKLVAKNGVKYLPKGTINPKQYHVDYDYYIYYYKNPKGIK